MIGVCTSFDSDGPCSAGGIRVMVPFCTVKISLKDTLKYRLRLKMFPQQNGLVDPTEVPLPIGLSWVTKMKTGIIKQKIIRNKKIIR